MRDFRFADEIFSTGNHSKIVPVTRFEDRDLQPGPVARKARELYWDWAHSTPLGVRLLEGNCRRGRTRSCSTAGTDSRYRSPVAVDGRIAFCKEGELPWLLNCPPCLTTTRRFSPSCRRRRSNIHHDKHHKAYVDNGNKLAAEAGMENLSLEEVVKQSFGKNAGLFNNAAPALQPRPLLEVDEEGRRRQQAARRAAEGGRQRSRRL